MHKSKFDILYESIMKECKHIIKQQSSPQKFQEMKKFLLSKKYFEDTINFPETFKNKIKHYQDEDEFYKVYKKLEYEINNNDYTIYQIQKDANSQEAERGPDFLDSFDLKDAPMSVTEFLSVLNQKLKEMQKNLLEQNPNVDLHKLEVKASERSSKERQQNRKENLEKQYKEKSVNKEQNFKKALAELEKITDNMEKSYDANVFPDLIKKQGKEYFDHQPYDDAISLLAGRYNLIIKDDNGKVEHDWFNRESIPADLYKRYVDISRKFKDRIWWQARHDKNGKTLSMPKPFWHKPGNKFEAPVDQFEQWFKKNN